MCDTSTSCNTHTHSCDKCYRNSTDSCQSGCRNIKFGKLFPVTIHNEDGTTSCGSIEYDQQLGKEVYQRAKNQFIVNAAQPLLTTYTTANKIVTANAETTQNIFFIFFIGFWILMALLTIFIFGAMCYGKNNRLSWFIVILLLIIIIPLLLLWWISSIYNNTYNSTKNHINNIIGPDGTLRHIGDACPSLECCDCSCSSYSDSCTSYKSCSPTSSSYSKTYSKTYCKTPCNTTSNTSYNPCSSTSGSSFTSKSSYDTLTECTDTKSTSDTTYGTCTDDN
jgi:hypothetical protein